MLGKQRKNNKVDQQFMDAAWKNMAEILDQEMPVERKERRIGWMSIAALLVMGFVGGISVMWGLQKHEPTSIASNHKINTTSEANIVSTPIVDKNKISINQSKQKETQTLTSNTVAYNSNTTFNNTTTRNSNTAKTNVVPTPTKDIIDTKTYVAQVNVVENIVTNNVAENVPAIMASTEIKLENSAVSASAIAMETVEEINPAMPLSELPILGLKTLPMANTSFGIDNDIDLPTNKKWRTGIYGGAIVAGKTGNGLEAAFRVERKLGAKWAVETGLGIRATQLAFLSKNQPVETLSISDGVSPNLGQAFVNADGDTLSRSIASQEIANIVNADEPNYQLTVPLSFVYRPTGKLRLALGMSWAYRLNKLKDASSFDNFMSADNEFSANGDFDQNSFSDRLNDIRLNFGVGYYLNPRTAIELAFSEGLSNGFITGSGDPSSSFTKSDDDLPSRFLQVGLIHYFGK